MKGPPWLPWAMGVGAILSMHVSAAAAGSTGRNAEPGTSHRTAATTERRKVGADVRSDTNTNRLRSLLDAQARGRTGLRARGRPAPQAHRTASSGSSGRTAPTPSGSIARTEPGSRGSAAASITAVPRVMGRPLATVNAASNTNAAARISRIGGPYAGGHATVGGHATAGGTATVGGPAMGRIQNGGKIDGSPPRHGF
ncbi:MAG: hypothetical protein M3O41_13600 [Pseudomonadota bacterium]|nr:hypothetical protein [Pseudomonadota bacterium]